MSRRHFAEERFYSYSVGGYIFKRKLLSIPGGGFAKTARNDVIFATEGFSIKFITFKGLSVFYCHHSNVISLYKAAMSKMTSLKRPWQAK